MRTIGLIRKTDNLGRIVIPKELRDFFLINKNEAVEILATEKGILIRNPKYEVKQLKDKTVT